MLLVHLLVDATLRACELARHRDRQAQKQKKKMCDPTVLRREDCISTLSSGRAPRPSLHQNTATTRARPATRARCASARTRADALIWPGAGRRPCRGPRAVLVKFAAEVPRQAPRHRQPQTTPGAAPRGSAKRRPATPEPGPRVVPHRSGKPASLVTNLEREVLAPVGNDHFYPRVGLPLGDGSSRVLEQLSERSACAS